MAVRLRVLDRVAWDGTEVPGERPAALLASLVEQRGGMTDLALAEAVWGDDPPAHPTKALQVLVSRLRSIDRDLVTRREGGYRLGLVDRGHDGSLDASPVDAWLLDDLVARSERHLRDGRPQDALPLARQAVAHEVAEGPVGPLGDLRARAVRRREAATRVLALALARTGRHTEALPALRERHRSAPDDVEVLTELLRASARVEGTASALERYDAYRRGLSGRLGIDPDPALQRVHRELLAADAPLQTGVLYDADELLGRDGDLAGLRGALSSGRLTTVLGPGGIGKTRIAHVLAREATQPRVHFVELVGVASGDDVVAEVGAALGIRGSVTARHALTPTQQADVRGRIAQELDTGPALLVLDNCEHVLEAAAGLVAFLLVTTRDLSVLTTSRAPLRIAAERVVPLSQLDLDDAAALFERRAHAARPEVSLDPEVVRAVVERLDGLPLAVELAAARVRTMSVEQIRDALDDRFGLLRTRDRTAPERHRTLTAVIEWSWELLSDDEREAAARMSVFHDGFDAGAARAVLGPDAADLVEALAEQSIVTVTEADGRTRFRMLETVREYAALRLTASGHREAALGAQRDWAVAEAARHGDLFFRADQVAAVQSLLAEENNLTDVLRRALSDRDAPTAARLLGALGSLWTITGNHARVFAVADAAQDVLADWDPEAGDQLDSAFEATAILLIHLSWIPSRDTADLRAAMARWGEPQHPWARASHAMFVDDRGEVVDRILRLARSETEPVNAPMLLIWAAINAENVGDVTAAAAYTHEALAKGPLTPYVEASLQAELSQLAMARGDHHTATVHAERAWPVLLQLRALDDASSMRLTAAISMLLDGDLDGCERRLDELGEMPEAGQLGSRMHVHTTRAELQLARGEVAAGLATYDRAVAEVEVDVPGWTGALTPWLLIAASGALAAHTIHSPPGPDARANELLHLLTSRAPDGADGPSTMDDLPLSGVLMVAVGAGALRFGPEGSAEDALRLLAIGHRWAYNRSVPSLAWERLAALAETRRPGRLGQLLEEYAAQSAPGLVPESLALLRQVAPRS